jgi:hypothetical protein
MRLSEMTVTVYFGCCDNAGKHKRTAMQETCHSDFSKHHSPFWNLHAVEVAPQPWPNTDDVDMFGRV